MTATNRLSGYTSSLDDAIEAGIRGVLSLKSNVAIDVAPLGGEPGAPVVPFELSFPNGGRLALALSAPGTAGRVSGRYSSLSYRVTDASDPETSAVDREAFVAVARLHRATEARGDPTAPLWEAARRARPFVGVEDYMYRQISTGTEGPTGYLRLGFRCNQDCHFCWQSRQWPDVPAQYYFSWLDELVGAGVRRLQITGGEPTLHDALAPLIARASERGLSVTLQTNAIRLRRRPFAERLKAAGLSALFVSFHSGFETVSDAMTRAPGTWKGTVAGIETALSLDFDVTLNCVVERSNAAHLTQHARFVVDRFVIPFDTPARMVAYSHPSTYYDAGMWEEQLAPLDEVGPRLVDAARILAAAGVRIETMGTCGFPPCLFRSAPELIRWMPAQTAATLDAHDSASREHGPVCAACAARDRCLGPRRAYRARFGDRGLTAFEV